MTERSPRAQGRDPTTKHLTERTVTRLSTARPQRDLLIVEAPLEIRIDDEPMATTMRTPGADHDLVLGMLFAEGVIADIDDVGTIAHCERPDQQEPGNIIDVRSGPGISLSSEASPQHHARLITSACGVCGRATIEDLLARCHPIEGFPRLPRSLLEQAMQHLHTAQPSFAASGGCHGAAAMDVNAELLAAAEDVGRHNAVDKVVGSLLRARRVGRSRGREPPAVLAVSGRTSFEIVQKAAVARIPVVAGISAPTSLAVDLANAMGITLAGFVRDDDANLYTHAQRFVIRSE